MQCRLSLEIDGTLVTVCGWLGPQDGEMESFIKTDFVKADEKRKRSALLFAWCIEDGVVERERRRGQRASLNAAECIKRRRREEEA